MIFTNQKPWRRRESNPLLWAGRFINRTASLGHFSSENAHGDSQRTFRTCAPVRSRHLDFFGDIVETDLPPGGDAPSTRMTCRSSTGTSPYDFRPAGASALGPLALASLPQDAGGAVSTWLEVYRPPRLKHLEHPHRKQPKPVTELLKQKKAENERTRKRRTVSLGAA